MVGLRVCKCNKKRKRGYIDMNANKGKDSMQKIFLLVVCVVVGFSGMVSGWATAEHGNKPVNIFFLFNSNSLIKV